MDMVEEREIPEKPFYKIAEVCQYTDTQPYVIRFWESEFPQLAPTKGRSGQRVYRREDIDLILRIKRLLHEEEYTIAGARRRLEEESGTFPTRTEVPRDLPPEASQADPPTLEDLPALGEVEILRSRLASVEGEKRHLEARVEELLREVERLRETEGAGRSELDRARVLAAEAAKQAAERSLRNQRARALEVAELLEETLARLDGLVAGLGEDESVDP
jgi:DNA-binding transcriptional MerR regulator